jgi:hypothetical protein
MRSVAGRAGGWAFLFCLVIAAGWCRADLPTHVLAESGQHAPGTPVEAGGEEDFRNFADLVLDRSGRIAFVADLLPNGHSSLTGGIWEATSRADLRLVAPTGGNHPTQFNDLLFPLGFYSNGSLAFVADGLPSDTVLGSGLFVAGPSGVRPLIIPNQQVPGTTAGTTFANVVFSFPNVTAAPVGGSIVVGAQTLGPNINPSGPPTRVQGRGTFLVDSVGSIQTLDPNYLPRFAYITPSGSVVLSIQEFSDSGTVLYAGTSGHLQSLVHLNLPPPGGVGGFLGGFSAETAAGDQIAFVGSLYGYSATTPQIVLAGTAAQGFHVVATANDLGPNYADPKSPAFISELHVDTSGGLTILTGGQYANGAIWSGRSESDLKQIAHYGQAAPGVAGDTIGSLSQALVNDAGQIVFQAQLLKDGTASGYALYTYDPAAGVVLLARSGQTLTLDDGQVKTVSDVAGAPATFIGGGAALNDQGELVWRAGFTDNSSALLITQIPEPSSAAAVVVGLALVTYRRRRV